MVSMFRMEGFEFCAWKGGKTGISRLRWEVSRVLGGRRQEAEGRGRRQRQKAEDRVGNDALVGRCGA